MKILVYGAGAVGGYLGGRLAQHDHQVTLITREVTAELIRKHGLTITEKGETELTRPGVASSVAQAFQGGESYDLIIMAMKAYDLAPALDPLIAFCPQPPVMITVQNGIGVEQPLIEQFGWEKVMAGTVTYPIRKETPHHLVTERDDGGLGLAPTEPKQKIKAWSRLLKSAGIQTQTYKDYRSMKWSKAFLNIIGNATSAILNRRPGLIYKSEALFDLELEMLHETLDVMKALNLSVVDLPGAAASRLAFGVRHLPRGLLKPILTRLVSGGRGEKMPSFHIDLTAGKGKSEVLYHNGAIAKAGQKAGVPTPVNTALAGILWKLTLEQIDWRQFDGRPKRLLAAVRRYEAQQGVS